VEKSQVARVQVVAFGARGREMKMKTIFVMAVVAVLVAMSFGVSSYQGDQAQLLEARRLARFDLLEEVSFLPQNFAIVAPNLGKRNCQRHTYLTYYVSQVCYRSHDIDAAGLQIRLYVVYHQPMSRLFQSLIQSNETYFEALELAEVVVRLYGNGTITRFGSAKVE
jgi:hypothetical protein